MNCASVTPTSALDAGAPRGAQQIASFEPLADQPLGHAITLHLDMASGSVIATTPRPAPAQSVTDGGRSARPAKLSN